MSLFALRIVNKYDDTSEEDTEESFVSNKLYEQLAEQQ